MTTQTLITNGRYFEYFLMLFFQPFQRNVPPKKRTGIPITNNGECLPTLDSIWSYLPLLRIIRKYGILSRKIFRTDWHLVPNFPIEQATRSLFTYFFHPNPSKMPSINKIVLSGIGYTEHSF